VATKTQDGAVPEQIKTTEGYAVSLRRRKMLEEAFGWVKNIGTLRRLMARAGQDSRACAAQFRRAQPHASGQFAGAVIRWRSRAIRSAA
jgi:hypothetical protein